jgi:hypothetical protein
MAVSGRLEGGTASNNARSFQHNVSRAGFLRLGWVRVEILAIISTLTTLKLPADWRRRSAAFLPI